MCERKGIVDSYKMLMKHLNLPEEKLATNIVLEMIKMINDKLS